MLALSNMLFNKQNLPSNKKSVANHVIEIAHMMLSIADREAPAVEALLPAFRDKKIISNSDVEKNRRISAIQRVSKF